MPLTCSLINRRMPDQAAPGRRQNRSRNEGGSAAPRAMVIKAAAPPNIASSSPRDESVRRRTRDCSTHLRRALRLLKSVRVTEFKGAFPSHRFSRPLFREVLLSDHVQGGSGWQLSTRRSLLARLFPDDIGGTLLARSAVRRAVSEERGTPQTMNAATPIITKNRTGLNCPKHDNRRLRPVVVAVLSVYDPYDIRDSRIQA